MTLLSCKSPGAVLGSGRQKMSGTPRSCLKEAVCQGLGHCVFMRLGPACHVLVAEPRRDCFVLGALQNPQQVELIFVSVLQGCPVLGSLCLVPKSQGLRRHSDFYHIRGSEIQGVSLPSIPPTTPLACQSSKVTNCPRGPYSLSPPPPSPKALRQPGSC